MSDGPEWFAAKRFGLGAGPPIAWQGWAVTALFVIGVTITALLFNDRPLVLCAILLPALMVFLIIAARTTRGGWRWRWGERD